jgi:hypothetical protein
MAMQVVSAPSLPVEKDLEATWVETYGPRDGVVPANGKAANAFRDYKKEERPSVRKFYRTHAAPAHAHTHTRHARHRERERERNGQSRARGKGVAVAVRP